jgi:L-threonylcarbamoyladenylate synthase
VYQPPAILPCPRCFAISHRMTELLAADESGIARAVALLRAGDLVAFGTETVYGLGADATNARAVARVFAAKERPHFNPLICHYPDRDAAFDDVVPNEVAYRLAASLWPGPLTLVLPRRPQSRVALLTTAGLDSLAVRVPSHPVASALLRAVGIPVAAPSANLSGTVSPTTAQHVLDDLAGRIAAVLESGPCPIGVESTVLDLTGDDPVLLRPGGTTLEAIEAEIGAIVQRGSTNGVLRSPGMMASHYAPSLPVRLDAVSVSMDEALLAFGIPLPGAGATFNLSPSSDPIEAAARLFVGLRELDATGPTQGCKCIAVMPVPSAGLGHAINDRLRRAATPR